MSNDVVISVEKISKRYRYGGMEHLGQNLRADIADWMSGLFCRNSRVRSATSGNSQPAVGLHHPTYPEVREKRIEGDPRYFWALKDVDFQVRRGKVVGIIGSNGAGKSTLLKILSRITPPTSGRITYHGRVSSLLEVGTGFHRELTGRENIFLNGSILGMKRSEIGRLFDQIVAFAEVEKFIDTPVKFYSSGMYVRLAFAVAAHLEPEILLVDEVLAVGDASFQKKCLGKMEDVSRHGRTVLFVSHNMSAIRRLCQQTIHIQAGRLVEFGDTAGVVHRYLEASSDAQLTPDMDLRNWPTRHGTGEARIISARLLDDTGAVTGVFQRTKPLTVAFEVESRCRAKLHLSAVCATNEGLRVLHLAHHDCPSFEPGVLSGTATVQFRIPNLPLLCGDYNWTIGVQTEFMDAVDVVTDVLPFHVEDPADTPRPYQSSNEHGLCYTPTEWEIAKPK